MRVWAAAVSAIILIGIGTWLWSSGVAVDRLRNDDLVRVLQLDRLLDDAKKSAHTVTRSTLTMRAAWAQLHASTGLTVRAGMAIKTMSDGSDAYRTATHALLASYEMLGLYQGDIRAARQIATNAVSLVQDALLSYVQAVHTGGSLLEGDRSFVRARLGFDNFNDATADLWRNALNRRNQPLEDARRSTKPFPLSLFDHPEYPPNRNDSSDSR